MGFRENFEKLSRTVGGDRVERPIGIHPRRFVKILVERGVSKHDPGVWVYMGIGRDYIVIPKVFCSCENFLIEVISGRRSYCKHLFFQQVSERSSSYREVLIEEGDLYRVIKEILNLNMSVTLRRIIYGGVVKGG